MKKVILVTGASSGIGKSIATYLSEKGYQVYGTSRNPENYSETSFSLLSLDVRNRASIDHAVQTVLAKEGRIDVLINNAGVGITGPLEEIPTAEIRNNFETNVFGPIEVMKAVLPTMRNQKKGLIINITSIAGYMGLPYRSIYSSSKGALELITEALRMEIKPFGVVLTNVAPGDFATDIASRRFHSEIIPNSDYADVYQKQLDTMNAHVNQGLAPDKMAQEILKIIETPNPKVHYKVASFLQKFSIVLKRILPDTWYEKMLMNHYKL